MKQKNKRRVERMIPQSVLPFKLKRTEEHITARSGLALYAEFMKAMRVTDLVNEYFPKGGSGNSYKASEYITPLSLMLYGGGESIEDVREIRGDATLRKLAGLQKIPSVSAIGDWLRRMGERSGVVATERVNTSICQNILRRDKGNNYTLIVDPTIIETGKREAQMTYLGYKGYRPVVATIKELGLSIAYEFKEGNDMSGRMDIIEKAFCVMPSGKTIGRVLLDSEYYSNEVMEYLHTTGVKWIVAGDKDKAVMENIKNVKEESWKPFRAKDEVMTDREIAETIHATEKGKGAFRLIVLRWRENQSELFGDNYRYHCLATNMTEESVSEVVWLYNERAQIENHIKEIKGGFGMERMPSGEFKANAIHFAIGIMTYNLFIAQRLLTMPEDWKNKTIKSIRWLLVEMAGKLIEHGRMTILKIVTGFEKYMVCLEIRRRTYELLRE
jgi:hypothetical protein